jgi:hypothetical protein
MFGTKRTKSLRSVLAVALLGAAFAVSQETASASAPQPSYTVNCALGGETTATWSHSKVTKLQIIWYDPGAGLAVTHPTISKGGPNGRFSVATPAAASGTTTVHVDFYTDTTSGSFEAPCI